MQSGWRQCRNGVASIAQGRTRFLQMVARSRSKVVKLWTGPSSVVRLVAALALALGERRAGATMKERRASRAGFVIIVEEDGCERSAHVPLYVVGERAEQDVGR